MLEGRVVPYHHQEHPYPISPSWILGGLEVLDTHSVGRESPVGVMFQILGLRDIRNTVKNTPVHHLLVGFLEDRMFLTHNLEVE